MKMNDIITKHFRDVLKTTYTENINIPEDSKELKLLESLSKAYTSAIDIAQSEWSSTRTKQQ